MIKIVTRIIIEHKNKNKQCDRSTDHLYFDNVSVIKIIHQNLPIKLNFFWK